jgi:hypothetical protein
MPRASAAVVRRIIPARDEVSEAVSRLSAVLPQREDSRVLLAFLEDALREGLSALGQVEEHFSDVLDGLTQEPRSSRRLLEISDDVRVLERLETLEVAVRDIRRRLSQAAAKVQLR